MLTGFGPGSTCRRAPTAWLIPNIDAFARTFNIYSNTRHVRARRASPTRRRAATTAAWTEQDHGVYLQADFSIRTGASRCAAISACAMSKTEQTSQGYLPAGGAPVLLTAVHEYSDVLPSLNLVREVTPELLMRFARGEGDDASGARPGDAGRHHQPRRQPRRRDGQPVARSDPRERPTTWRLEWYFDEGALLSGAVFYKDIETFVQTLVENDAVQPVRLSAEPAGRHDAHRHRSLRVQQPGEHRGRAAQGIRDQLPAAVQVPARRVEQLRHVAQLHVRRFGDRLRDVDDAARRRR